MRQPDRLTKIEQQIEAVKTRLATLPKGTANVFECRGHLRFRGTLNGEKHYFNQSEQKLIDALIVKQYLSYKLEDLLALKAHLLACDAREQRCKAKAQAYLLKHPVYAETVRKYLHDTVLPAVRAYDEAPLQEMRTEETVEGLLVRSKSEVMIAAMLYERGLSFSYEEPLRLGMKTYYPDFTIHFPNEKPAFRFEHFGMMDDESYIRRNYTKLIDYAVYGIIPNVNLVITYETKNHTLKLSQIEKAISIIEEYAG